jgi:hypothetical protein
MPMGLGVRDALLGVSLGGRFLTGQTNAAIAALTALKRAIVRRRLRFDLAAPAAGLEFFRRQARSHPPHVVDRSTAMVVEESIYQPLETTAPGCTQPSTTDHPWSSKTTSPVRGLRSRSPPTLQQLSPIKAVSPKGCGPLGYLQFDLIIAAQGCAYGAAKVRYFTGRDPCRFRRIGSDLAGGD